MTNGTDKGTLTSCQYLLAVSFGNFPDSGCNSLVEHSGAGVVWVGGGFPSLGWVKDLQPRSKNVYVWCC